MNNPTIVSAALSDKELQDSINRMVANFDRGLQKMLDHSNEYVEKIQKSLQKIGNVNFGATGSNDGGVAKQTKAQEEFTESVKRSTNEIKKHGKESEMTFDQIANALSQARRTVSDFNTKRASGILPSSDDYKRYEQALARIVEYNDKLKQSALSRADANQWANVFDARRNTKDLFSTDERLKQLNKYYAEQEKLSQKATQDEERQRQKRVAAMEKESAAQKKIIDDQYKLSFARTMKIPTDQLDLAQAKLERLQALLRDMRERGILSNAQIASTEAEIRKLEQIIGQVNTAQQQTTQSAQRYTDEIRKQAAAIRATKEWQEKGHVVIGDVNYYDKERANVSKRDKQLLLSLEEQIVQAQQKEAQEALVAAEAKRQQAQAAKEAAQSSKGVSAYDLGIDPNISVGRQRQIESTRAASKETEYLKQQVASLLEIEEREVKSVNMTTASYSELSQHLKQLQSAYNKLGADRIKKGEGVDIANEIQRTQRAMQKLQQTMSRPVSLKDALGGSEKTLDDLAYKMRRLQSYRGGLNFKTQSDEVLRVNQKYTELQKKMDVIMERNQRMIASNNALGRSWNYMKNRLAFYVTVGASTSFIKNLIEVRSQYEMNEKALGILLDSASRGTRIFNELSQMALVSPYTLIELSNAAKQLTAYDIAAKDVVDTTRRLADMASAVGVPVERLTYALGQIKAYGYLNSRDARMFANAGIPLVKQLADRYSELEGKMVSTADVYDRMKKKAIDYNNVMAVINKMTDEGGKFFDFQAKMAETLKVRLANLTLAWNNMLNDIGKDNQGVMTTGLKGLTVMFKHWRELYRIISTVIVAIGAYKTASMVAGIAASRAISSTIPAWFRLASIVRTTQGNMALLGLTMRSIPFTAWVTAIATLASYFIFFNNSSDDVKQKLEDIKSAFDGVRKEVETLFADAIKTDNIGTQLTKLRDMLELAETELGVTIPIRLEDVNESNIKQKLKEAKQFVDEYINFSQTFSEAAAGTKFNELMNDFGSKARSTYTNVTESINSVVVALQELSDKGQASKRDIEILNELTSGQKEDESRIEYLQRLVSLYEELGLIGQKKVTPKISFFGSSEDNVEELEQQQENALNRLDIKNKSVFENMLKDVQGYYSSSSIAAYQFEQQVMRVAKKIDINNIPVEQRTMKLTAAINEEASQNNWNQFEKEFARQIANEKFGTTIEISDESKKAAEEDLQAWQQRQVNWFANNKIDVKLDFQTNDTELSYAKRTLQDYKDKLDEVDVQRRKLNAGTGLQSELDAAIEAAKKAKIIAKEAGADLSSLNKGKGKKKDPLLDALKQEISLVEKLQGDYDKLSKSGASQAEALDTIRGAYGKTIRLLNAQLGNYGLPQLNISQLITGKDPNKALAHFKQTLNTLVSKGLLTLERSKELEAVVEKFTLSAKTYNLDMITKGLNNELGKLKDEYELAVELDANPELGNMFADFMGVNIDELPKDFEQATKKAQKYIDELFAKNNRTSNIDIASMLDRRSFNRWISGSGLSMDSELVKGVDAFRQYLHKVQVDENKKMTDEWSKLVEKYGDLQAKMLKIYKDSVQEQIGIVRKFGDSGEVQEALDLSKKINLSQDPAEIARLQEQLANIIKSVVARNPQALNIATAIENKGKSETAKATWEDFKNSELYTMTFEDMANNSTRAIQLIMDKLEGLKDKVKEDPASMKALMKSLEDAQKELNTRDPFGGVARSLRDIANASQEAKTAQEALWRAEVDVEQAQQQVDNVEDGTPEEQAAAQQKLSDAIQRRAAAQVKLTQAENKGKKAQENLKSSLQGISNQLGNVQELFGVVSKLFRAGGDDETADAIDAISEGFSIMTTVIMGVVAAMIILESTTPWLLAIAAALSVIVGLVSFLSGQDNKRIDAEIKESELAVKRLENAYKMLEYAAGNAFGAATAGAQQAIKANKELQLAELKRQLMLEQSRDSKDRDEDRIVEIRGQIIDLEHEINDFTKNAVNDLLGISSHGDFFESMIKDMIEAFKNGEDAMEVFNEKWSDMIDNMLMKTIVTQVLSRWVKSLEKGANEILQKRTEGQASIISNETRHLDWIKTLDAGDTTAWLWQYDKDLLNNILTQLGERAAPDDAYNFWRWNDRAWDTGLAHRIQAVYQQMLQNRIDNANNELEKESLKATLDLTDYYTQAGEEFKEDLLPQILDKIKENWNFGQDSEKQLSNLQQGISQISENTAESLEAYMNGVSQQVYYHSSLLEQIRDSVVGLDLDVSLGVQSQMLLQLQNSYQTQQAIQQILEGVLVPSGRAFAVELTS